MQAVRDATGSEVSPVLLAAIGGPYPLQPVLSEKLREGYRGKPAFLLAESGGRPAGAAVLCGEYVRLIGVDPSCRGGGIGSALLAECEQRIAATFDRVVIAAEPGNYFTPGALESQVGFFAARGYEATASSVNLVAPTEIRTENNAKRAFSQDRARVLDFVESNFGKIWRFETTRAFERDDPSVVFTEDRGVITGFTAWGANNAALGTVGPAGVARADRGSGLGKELLHAVLSHMRAEGFSEALIQWAAAIDFYERSAGARVAHRFVVLEKRLGA